MYYKDFLPLRWFPTSWRNWQLFPPQQQGCSETPPQSCNNDVFYIKIDTHTHNYVVILDTSVALDSLLFDVGQWSRGCVRQGVNEVCWWSWLGVWRSKSFTGILTFHLNCPHFLLPSLIFDLLLRQWQIKQSWRKTGKQCVMKSTKTRLERYIAFFFHKSFYLRTVPFRPIFVLESISPRWISEVIKSGWSWINQSLVIYS